jgi:hypothetical protein
VTKVNKAVHLSATKVVFLLQKKEVDRAVHLSASEVGKAMHLSATEKCPHWNAS